MSITTDKLINNLILYYSLANMKELAEKINVSQSVVSSWKIRNSVGALINKIAEIDIDALSFILSSNETKDTVLSEINNAIFINEKLLEKSRIEAEKYGFSLTNYIEHLIVQDIKNTSK
jgi:hypothetical protein